MGGVPARQRSNSEDGPEGPREHPLVARLTAAGGVGSAVVLTGYLGRSPEEAHWRLYTTAALDEYVDIPDDALISSTELPDDEGNRVWVKKGTSLVVTQISSYSVQADLLAGTGGATQRVVTVGGGVPAVSALCEDTAGLACSRTNLGTHCGCWPAGTGAVACYTIVGACSWTAQCGNPSNLSNAYSQCCA